MTKAELLERIQKLEADQTKAKLLERIQVLEDGPPNVSAATLAAMPAAVSAPLEVHTVSLNGATYSWSDGGEASVPEEAVAVYQRMKAANS